jgi:hypothetical protein
MEVSIFGIRTVSKGSRCVPLIFFKDMYFTFSIGQGSYCHDFFDIFLYMNHYMKWNGKNNV